jgi:hypothetical protein
MIKGRQHKQHTVKFINELNSVNNNKLLQPFRYYDEIWVVGKYKGITLSNTPKSYINWSLTNMKLTKTAYSILNKHR